jgi:DNA-binding NtrC family response regulator
VGETELSSQRVFLRLCLKASPRKDSRSRYHETLQETKKHLIRQAIEHAQGSIREAAKYLGVHSNYLHRLIRNLNLRDEPPKFRLAGGLGGTGLQRPGLGS